jgi:hypothetical protein
VTLRATIYASGVQTENTARYLEVIQRIDNRLGREYALDK